MVALAAVGCAVWAARAPVTFTKDVAPILFAHCAECHRAGEVAPFSLLTYADAQKRARQLAVVTEKRTMPPWKADSHGEFQNERRLAPGQIETLRRWADADAPEGNRADLPPPPKFADGWQLGEPDAVFEPKEEYSLAAEGQDVYGIFVLPTNYPEERWVSGVEVRPGNRAVVHHVLLFLDSTGAARKLDEADPGPGYSRFGGLGFLPSGGLGGWAPGNFPNRMPEGIGTRLPKGADIVIQVHYHKSGKPEKDRTKVGLHFSRKPVDKQMRMAVVVNPFLRIPPGDANHTVRATLPVTQNITVRGVTPHMHLLGREMTVTATMADGKQKSLVRVPDWDFNWQTSYSFKQPFQVAAGSRFDVVARYDNSEKNPRNPSRPPKPVTWGEETTDEMCIAFVGYTVDAEQLTKGIAAPGIGDFFGARGGGGQRLRDFLRQRREGGASPQ